MFEEIPTPFIWIDAPTVRRNLDRVLDHLRLIGGHAVQNLAGFLPGEQFVGVTPHEFGEVRGQHAERVHGGHGAPCAFSRTAASDSRSAAPASISFSSNRARQSTSFLTRNAPLDDEWP